MLHINQKLNLKECYAKYSFCIRSFSVILLFFASSSITVFAQTVTGLTTDGKCENCCEIGLVTNTKQNFDLLGVSLPLGYTYGANPTTNEKKILTSTYHSGITVTMKEKKINSIFDYGAGAGAWSEMKKKDENLTIKEFINTLMGKHSDDYYHLVFTVPQKSCESILAYWANKATIDSDYNPKSYNCHIVTIESLTHSLDADTKVNQYFTKNINDDRWGVLNFRKALNMVSSCGVEKGKAPRLEVYKYTGNNPTLPVIITPNTADIDGCQCSTSPETCNPEDPNPNNQRKELPIATSVFPNPADNLFQLEIDNPNKDLLSVQLLDVYGRVVYEGQVIKSIEISVAKLTKGVYTVNVYNEQKHYASHKVMVK
jgi:hypothetical protein